jgi:hypothetical protein
LQRPSDESGWQPWQIALPESRFKYPLEYASDPETGVIAFDELWRDAGDAPTNRQKAFLKTLRWMLLEMREASRWGRTFLTLLPDSYRKAIDDGAEIAVPYKKFHEIYLICACDHLSRSVHMAVRGYGKFGLRADAIIDLATEISTQAEEWSISASGIEQTVSRLDLTAQILEELLRDSTPTPTDKPDAGGTDSEVGPTVGDAEVEGGPPPKPKWDRDNKTLSFSGVQRKYRQSKNQFKLLDAFVKSGWEETIANPLRDTVILSQTVKDMNKVLKGLGLIRLRMDDPRVGWKPDKSDLP